ncbi:MAG: PD-(D/E)XK nuclease family protein, partial [Myxococcota bacterium]
LGRLLDAFNGELTRLGLADMAHTLAAAIERQAALEDETPSLPTATLLLDLMPETRLERRWLQTVVAHSGPVLAIHAAGDPRVVGPPPSLEHLLATTAEVLPDDEDRALTRARAKIFTVDPVHNDEGQDDSLAFFSAPGEAQECVEIARRIRTEATKGRRFDEMAVLLPRTRVYQSMIEDALSRAKIPTFSTARARRPHPGGRALLALLACANENLSAHRFAEYLSLGQVPRLGNNGLPPSDPVPWVAPKDERQLTFATSERPPDDPDLGPETDDDPAPAGHLQTPLHWERLLVDAEIRIGGADRWRRRLEGYEAELRLQLRRLSEDRDDIRERKQADLRSLRRLQRFSLPVIESLEKLPDDARWSVWLQQLQNLAARALREPEPVLQVLAELAPLKDVGPVRLDEVRQVLQDRLAFLQQEPRDHRYGKVFVAPIEEAAGRTFSVVFLPGLAQGVFPPPVYEDPLLLDPAAQRLSPDLPTSASRRTQFRQHLRAALGAARDRFVASYPRLDGLQGRARVPSFYAFDLLRAARGQPPTLQLFEREAAQAAGQHWGWPAPHQPEAAVDDSEYDLAVLSPHLHAPATQVRGCGRYLLDDGRGRPRNAFLLRSLQAEARRWRSPWTYADGLIVRQPEEQRVLDAHHPANRPYSATALQHFAYCPYRFVLQAIHRLRPREPVAP